MRYVQVDDVDTPTAVVRQTGPNRYTGEPKLDDGVHILPPPGQSWADHPELAVLCGFLPLTTTDRPAETRDTRQEPANAIVIAGVPTQQWQTVAKDAAEQQAWDDRVAQESASDARRIDLSAMLDVADTWSDQQDADADAIAALPSGNNAELRDIILALQQYIGLRWGGRDATQRRRLAALLRELGFGE